MAVCQLPHRTALDFALGASEYLSELRDPGGQRVGVVAVLTWQLAALSCLLEP